MNSDIIIRTIESNDADLVNEFFDQMGPESRSFVNRGNHNRNGILRYVNGARDNTICWMAEKDGKMVGLVWLWDLDKRIPWLGIAVGENIKGKNLGGRLLGHAESYASENGYGGIFLTTHTANLRGQVAYEKAGYEKLGLHMGSMEFLYIRRFDK
ncbi:MAG: GNAT family N-acetyltransferase [Clostridia bacterium]|nr:GNAT family N-acetyltransferase [Clostridia bacterium]